LAKTEIVCAGYADEIDWQQSVRFEEVTESDLLRENAWVVLSCGMRESIVRARFPKVAACFHDWESADRVLADMPQCRERALRYFHHPAKIDAIITCAQWIVMEGFARAKEAIYRNPLVALQWLPFIGPVTVYHLAKNLGLPVAKPDRHLLRLAKAAGYQDVQEFCADIAQCTGDPVPVVDIVLWRFATLRRDYLTTFAQRVQQDSGACRQLAPRLRVAARVTVDPRARGDRIPHMEPQPHQRRAGSTRARRPDAE
jgi:hypothetical protein